MARIIKRLKSNKDNIAQLKAAADTKVSNQ